MPQMFAHDSTRLLLLDTTSKQQLYGLHKRQHSTSIEYPASCQQNETYLEAYIVPGIIREDPRNAFRSHSGIFLFHRLLHIINLTIELYSFCSVRFSEVLVQPRDLYEAALQAVHCSEEKMRHLHPRFLLFYQRWHCLSGVAAPPWVALASYGPFQCLQMQPLDDIQFCPLMCCHSTGGQQEL